MPTETFVVEKFNLGAILSIPADEIPEDASPRLYNTRMQSQAGGGFEIEKRPGLVYAATHTSGQNINGLTTYRYASTSGITEYIIGVNTSGSINKLESPTSTYVSQTGVTASGTGLWRFAQAKNRVYGCNGTSQFVVYRTTGSSTLNAYQWGFDTPAAPTGSSVGGGSSAAGTYDVTVTWYNSDLDEESSPSETYLELGVATNDTFTINRPTIPSNATHWNIYVRRQNSMTQLYRNSNLRFAAATTTTTFSLTLANLDALTIRAPEVNSNNKPPVTFSEIEFHLNRMFGTDGDLLYYSNIDEPGNFNILSFEPVNRYDGEKITNLISYDTTTLVILKTRSIYVLTGTGPQNWQVERIPTTYGSVATGAAVLANTAIFSWSAQGPIKYEVGSLPEPLFSETVTPLSRAGVLTLEGTNPRAIYDPVERRVLFTLATTSSASRWTIAPYSLERQCWEAIGWDLPTSYSWTLTVGSNSEIQPTLGLSNGIVGQLDRSVMTDMAQNSTGANLHFVATGISTTQLTYSYTSASLPPYRNKFTSKVVVINGSDMSTHQSEFSITTSSTSTQTLTLTTPMSTTASSGSVIVFDMPVAEIDTKSQRYVSNLTRFIKVFGDIDCVSDVKAFFGALKNNETSCSTVWHPAIKASQAYEYQTEGSTISGAERLFKTFYGSRGLALRLRAILYYPVRHSLTKLGWQLFVQGDNR